MLSKRFGEWVNQWTNKLVSKWIIGKYQQLALFSSQKLPSHLGMFLILSPGGLSASLASPGLYSCLFPSSTGRCPDQPGWGLSVWGEVNSLVQRPELQILEETEQGAQASGSQGPYPRAWKHGELGPGLAPASYVCSIWMDGRKSSPRIRDDWASEVGEAAEGIEQRRGRDRRDLCEGAARPICSCPLLHLCSPLLNLACCNISCLMKTLIYDFF